MTTWQETLSESATLNERAGKAKKKAGVLLWEGAQNGIKSWLPNSDKDSTAEKFGQAVTEALGAGRKGDASKIKTVALAVKNNGLVLASFDNLAKAYAEATRLTKTVKAQAAEDDAADEAVQSIDAPKSSSKPEGAALIVMAQGVDEAARLLLDALNVKEGEQNTAAHRAFLRAISQEITGRIPKPEPKPKAPAKPKKSAKAAKKSAAPAKRAAVKSGADKAKVSPAKGEPAAKAAPAKRAVARPVARPVPRPVK